MIDVVGLMQFFFRKITHDSGALRRVLIHYLSTSIINSTGTVETKTRNEKWLGYFLNICISKNKYLSIRRYFEAYLKIQKAE